MLLTIKSDLSRPLYKKAFLLLLSLFIGLSAACSPTARRRMLNIFFDGVPPLEQPKAANAADTLQHATGAEGMLPDTTTVIQPVFSFHPKLENSECKPCHDIGQSFRLYDEPEELCFKCHNQAGASQVHAPVEEGACTECHDPHGTKTPALLIENSNDLCYQCHDESDILPSDAKSTHAPVADGKCWQCHNPHSADNQYFLK